MIPLKTYIYAAVLATLITLWGLSLYFAYDYGKGQERTAVENEQSEARNKLAKALKEIEAIKATREVVTRERVRVIDTAPGDLWNQRITPPEALQAIKDG